MNKHIEPELPWPWQSSKPRYIAMLEGIKQHSGLQQECFFLYILFSFVSFDAPVRQHPSSGSTLSIKEPAKRNNHDRAIFLLMNRRGRGLGAASAAAAAAGEAEPAQDAFL